MKYPKGMEPVERTDIMPVSETSGQIDVNSRAYPLYKYTLYWEASETTPSIENALNARVTNFKAKNPLITVTMSSSKVTMTKANHLMVYQEFEMIEQGSNLFGFAGTWYCEKTSKIFTVFYYDLDKDLVRTFLKFIESSIICY